MSVSTPILTYGTLPVGPVALGIEHTAEGPVVIGAPASPGNLWGRMALACAGAGAFTALAFVTAARGGASGVLPPATVISLLVAWGLTAVYGSLLLLNRDLPTVVAVRDGDLVISRPRLGRLHTRVIPANRIWGLRAIPHGTSLSLKTVGELRVYPAWRLPLTLFGGHEMRLLREAVRALDMGLSAAGPGRGPEPTTPAR